MISLFPSADEAIVCEGLVQELNAGALVICIHDVPKLVEYETMGGATTKIFLPAADMATLITAASRALDVMIILFEAQLAPALVEQKTAPIDEKDEPDTMGATAAIVLPSADIATEPQ
jgi:hypothetical protein